MWELHLVFSCLSNLSACIAHPSKPQATQLITVYQHEFIAECISLSACQNKSITFIKLLSMPLSLATDVIDATVGASGLWLETRTGAGGTATLA